MFKGAAIALLVPLGAGQVANRGQITDAAATMLKQIARAYDI
ncbi:hypothetical protein [Bradyrhizobium monzae]|nr:hypothetical protein [Bradyrhizobium sp. Oc8]